MSNVMQKKQKNKLLGGVHPSVIAIWAALIATGHLLPAIPIFGSGGTFSVSSALIPLSGVFFGPIGGAICCAIGSFIGQMIAPHIAWLGIGTFLISTVNGFVTGCITRRKWYLSAGVIGIGYILWFSVEVLRSALLFPLVFYTMGLALCALGGFIYKDNSLTKRKPVFRVIGVFAASFAGFVGAAALANFAGQLLYQWPAAMWNGLLFIAPWERTIFAVGATIIGVPLLIGLPKIGVFVGPEVEELDEEDDDENEE